MEKLPLTESPHPHTQNPSRAWEENSSFHVLMLELVIFHSQRMPLTNLFLLVSMLEVLNEYVGKCQRNAKEALYNKNMDMINTLWHGLDCPRIIGFEVD